MLVFLLFFCLFLWSSRKIFCNDTMQRSWIWLRKPQAKRSICSVFVAIFLCGKTGVQVPNMWFPLTTTSDPQLANPVRRRSRCAFHKSVSCWTGATNNCSNTCRVEPKFNLLEAKVCVFVWCEVRFFFDFLFLLWQGWSTMTTPSQVACFKKRDVWAYWPWSNDRFLWQKQLRKHLRWSHALWTIVSTS